MWQKEWGPYVKKLTALQKQMGVEVQALKSRPELPQHLNPVFNMFLQLSRQRQPGMMGPAALTYADMGWYQWSRGIRSGYLMDLTSMVDQEWLDLMTGESKGKKE